MSYASNSQLRKSVIKVLVEAGKPLNEWTLIDKVKEELGPGGRVTPSRVRETLVTLDYLGFIDWDFDKGWKLLKV